MALAAKGSTKWAVKRIFISTAFPAGDFAGTQHCALSREAFMVSDYSHSASGVRARIRTRYHPEQCLCGRVLQLQHSEERTCGTRRIDQALLRQLPTLWNQMLSRKIFEWVMQNCGYFCGGGGCFWVFWKIVEEIFYHGHMEPFQNMD